MHFCYSTFVLLGYISGLSICCIKTDSSFNEPLVSAPWGNVKGATFTSRLGKPIYSFRGIRYAEPPVKKLRFKPPVPIEKVEGLYNATQDIPLCPQPTSDPTSEDCLFLSVYTTMLPNNKNNPKRPVIVYIHPGSYFRKGSSSALVGPQYLLDKNIVLVTFNYRIGSLGFISTGDKEAPGNNGLKDQVVALKWVQKNIKAFGGNPDSVTILGYSAGAESVILHMVSPMSTTLFHRAAAMSGSALGIVPITQNQRNVAQKQAWILGCPNDTSSNIINCLRTKSAQDLGNSVIQFREFGTDPLLIWGPVIEPDVGEPRFLTDHPIRLITKGQFKQVPFISGRNTEELSYFALSVLENNTLIKELNDNFEKIAPITFEYERDTNFSKFVSSGIKSFYFHNKPVDKSQESALKEAYEDSIIGFEMYRTAELISQYSKSPVYYYKFSYQGRYSHFYLPGTNNTVPYGVVHLDDLIYLFYNSELFPLFKENSPKEAEMVEKLTSLYFNFAETGNPTPNITKTLDNIKWEPYDTKNQKYLDIGQQLVLKEKLIINRFQFWEKLYPVEMYLQESSDK